MSEAPETIYKRMKARIAYLERRLELIGTDGNGNRVRMPESADGIACRDATIANLQQHLTDATIRIGTLVSTLRHIQHNCWGMTSHGIETMARDALTKEG